MDVDERGTLEALKAHRREVIDPAIASHKGRIVKTTGDGMLVELVGAVDAVTCTMAVQGQMAERDRPTARTGHSILIALPGEDGFVVRGIMIEICRALAALTHAFKSRDVTTGNRDTEQRITRRSIVLSDKSRPVIQAILPAVGAHIQDIAKCFYGLLFAAHPELLDGLFNRSHQPDASSKPWLDRWPHSPPLW